jgi:CelD/BcsL family acetyltransferase involved in cellulose biosynthesis
MGVDSHSKKRAREMDDPGEPTGIVRTLVIDRLDELEQYADAWNALSYDAPPRLPTSSHAWISTHFEHALRTDQTWCCILAHINDRLAGVLPLVVSRRSKVGLEWLSTPMSGHIIAVSPLLLPGKESMLLGALLKAAWTSHPDAVWIQLSDLAAGSSCAEYLGNHLNLKIKTRTGRYLRVDAEQERYQSSLSRNFRSNQHKAANKLKKLHGVETTIVTGRQASSAQLSEFIPVEASGWKGRAGTAIQQSSDLIAFYTTLTRRLAEAGWLEWHFLRAEGHTIAANLAIHFNRAIFVWKLGYDEKYRRLSPGGMLFQFLLDQAFADPDIDEVNLLTNASWYDNWKMEEREYYRIRIYHGHRPLSILFGLIPNTLIYVPVRNKRLRSFIRAGLRQIRKRPHE